VDNGPFFVATVDDLIPVNPRDPATYPLPHSAIAVGSDGLPLIVYVDHDIEVAHCDDPACSSVTITLLMSAYGSDPPENVSIAIGVDGLALISWFCGSDLLVAHCGDLACTSFTASSYGFSGSSGSGRTSITLGIDGLPIVAASNQTTIQIVRCDDLACSSGDSYELPGVGGRASIATGLDGLLYVFYIEPWDSFVQEGGLRFVRCPDPECWLEPDDIVELVEGDYEGVAASMIGADGLFIVSCFGWDEHPNHPSYFGDVMRSYVYRFTSSLPGGAYDEIYQDPDYEFGSGFASIAVGADGLPLISAAGLKTDFPPDPSESYLYLAVDHCRDWNCTSPDRFHLYKLEEGSYDAGLSLNYVHTSIAVGPDGMAWISYFDYGDGPIGALKVVRTILGRGQR
jgi:hypothetical protein